MTEPLVERVAQAMYASLGLPWAWDGLPAWRREDWRALARAAIGAMVETDEEGE